MSRGGYRAVRLDYELDDLGLVIVLPDDVEGAAAVARRLDANTLTELFAALRDGKARKPVALALPRFKAEYKADLVEPFRQMGMRKAFDPAAADFSGMTGKPAGQGGVYLGTVLHRAVIDVSRGKHRGRGGDGRRHPPDGGRAAGDATRAVPRRSPLPVLSRRRHHGADPVPGTDQRSAVTAGTAVVSWPNGGHPGSMP